MAPSRSPVRSEEHTSELQSPRSTLFPYTTLFRSGARRWRPYRGDFPPGPCAGRRDICEGVGWRPRDRRLDRKSTRLNSSHRDLPSFPTRRSSDLVLGGGDRIGVIFPQDLAPAGETFAKESDGALAIAGFFQEEGQIVH